MKFTAVKILITANVLVFVLQALSKGALDGLFALWPLQSIEGESYFHFWQIITYAFLHSTDNVTHLLFNMLGLWMFASVVTAALSQLFIPILFGAPPAPTIGASGGVFGLLLAYACLFPRRKVIPLIPPIPMPAWLFAALYAGVELFLGVTGTLSGVAHFAHLGGMVGSALVIMQWRFARARG
jgi:membrane associated rhomboid family serine protease